MINCMNWINVILNSLGNSLLKIRDYDNNDFVCSLDDKIHDFRFRNLDKSYRFYYHYVHRTGQLSVHFRDKCYWVDDVVCFVPTNSKWNKTQPCLVMQGYCTQVRILNKKAFIL